MIDFVTLMAHVLWHLTWIPACGLAALAVSRWMSPRRPRCSRQPACRPHDISLLAPLDRCTHYHAHAACRPQSETPPAARRAA